MITPTLFNVATISGLLPTREVFKPTVMDENTIDFDKTVSVSPNLSVTVMIPQLTNCQIKNIYLF